MQSKLFQILLQIMHHTRGYFEDEIWKHDRRDSNGKLEGCQHHREVTCKKANNFPKEMRNDERI